MTFLSFVAYVHRRIDSA